MFRRFVPLNAVAVVGAQFASASTKKLANKNNKVTTPDTDAPLSRAEIKAANRRSALSALNTDTESKQMMKGEKLSKQGSSVPEAKADFDFPSPSFVNRETVAQEGAYSQSLGFKSVTDNEARDTKNKDASGAKLSTKISSKSDKNQMDSKEALKEQVKEMDWEGAASQPLPASKLMASEESSGSGNKSKEAVKEPAKVAKHEANKMDYEGAAQHPATAAQLAEDDDVESNYETHKKAQEVSPSSDKDASKASNEVHDYNAHNLPPTPLQEITTAISSMAGRLFSKGASAEDPKKEKIEADKMDYEGAAQHPATAARLAAHDEVESNYETQKKAEQRGSSNRISSSSGESEQPFVKSSINASRVVETPSVSGYLFGKYTNPQASSHEAYATASNSDLSRSTNDINKTSSADQSSSPLQGISSAISNVASRMFPKDSSSDSFVGAETQQASVPSGPAIHTSFADANPLVGDASSGGNAASSNSGNNSSGPYNLSSLKKTPPTDYSSPDYLIRRT